METMDIPVRDPEPQASTLPAPAALARALIVDDNQINRNLLVGILKHLGWASEVAENGEQALAALRARAFDLVLLDLRMPGISGNEVCQRIRDELGLTRLPVVAYTAHGMLEDRARILADGFDGMLIKPVSITDLKAVCAEFGPQRA